jgi:pyridoxal phosphate-dependent aminotransferase EpsN
VSTGLVDEGTGARTRIYLSPPHMSGEEQSFVDQAFATNWVAPLGPNVDAFECELADCVGAEDTVALSSGTAALHLALSLCGVGPGDVVLGSTFTFVCLRKTSGTEPGMAHCRKRSWWSISTGNRRA